MKMVTNLIFLENNGPELLSSANISRAVLDEFFIYFQQALFRGVLLSSTASAMFR
jgi:hypothetical protein